MLTVYHNTIKQQEQRRCSYARHDHYQGEF